MSSRVLIVYDKLGMGHLRMANILKSILQENNTEVILAAGSDLLETSDIKLSVSLWNYVIRKNWIRTANIAINYIARIIFPVIGEITHSKHLFEEIDKLKPDIIICTVDVFNRSLGNYAQRHNIPFYIFITDIAIFFDLVHPYATHIIYFQETANAVRNIDFSRIYFREKVDEYSPFRARMSFLFGNYAEFLLKGISSLYRNPQQLLPELNQAEYLCVGPLAEKKHFAVKDRINLKQKYQVPSGVDTVLLASGSLGGKLLQDVIDRLESHCNRPLNLLVMCGHDEGLYQKLNHFQKHNSKLNILPFAFTNDFDEFLEIADCAIIRPSAGVFMESLIKKTPVITFALVADNDRGSLTIINKYQVGKVCRHYSDLVQCIDIILDNKKQYQKNIDKLLSAYPKNWEEKSLVLKELIMKQQNQGQLA